MKEEPLQMVLNHVEHLYRQQAVHLLGEYDVKPHQAGILLTLDGKGQLSQRELAELLRISPPSITVALKKMEQEGYLTREQDQNDQRIIRLSVTDKGKNCVKSVRETFRQMDGILFEGMSAEERLLLRRLLIQMRGNLHKSMQEQGIKGCAFPHTHHHTD